MGWLFVHRPSGQSHREFFTQQFAGDHGRRVVDVAAPRWDEAYVAYQVPQGVLCIGVMMRRAPHSYYNFGYKDMDESLAPCLYHCPQRILAQLSPTADLFEMTGPDGPLASARRWRTQQPAFDPGRHNP